MKRINIECKGLSDAERLALAEELHGPAGEFFAMLSGAILLLLFLLTWLKPRVSSTNYAVCLCCANLIHGHAVCGSS
jgi:hypothetical protein